MQMGVVAQGLQQGRNFLSNFSKNRKERKTASLPGLGGRMKNDSSGEVGGQRWEEACFVWGGAQPMVKAGVYHTQ